LARHLRAEARVVAERPAVAAADRDLTPGGTVVGDGDRQGVAPVVDRLELLPEALGQLVAGQQEGPDVGERRAVGGDLERAGAADRVAGAAVGVAVDAGDRAGDGDDQGGAVEVGGDAVVAGGGERDGHDAGRARDHLVRWRRQGRPGDAGDRLT